jgi:hypothetical protein
MAPPIILRAGGAGYDVITAYLRADVIWCTFMVKPTGWEGQ